MRFFFVAVFALFLSIPASAQNTAQMAAQQSMQAAQASQQANEAAARASQQAMDESMRAMRTNACCMTLFAAPPHFSRKPGMYHSGVKVRLKDRTRGAIMYYTTDGWTPTPASRRYTGPITITSTTTIQAIAIAPGYQNSLIASAVYTIPGAPAPPVPPVATLKAGEPLHLVFTAAVNSKKPQIGDTLPVVLAQDLEFGGVVVAPKSTPVRTMVMQVDAPGGDGAPGTITFAAHSITLNNGETISLSGTETLNGRSRLKTADVLYVIPLGGLFVHGKQANILKGATFTAFIQSTDPAVSAANTSEPQPLLNGESHR